MESGETTERTAIPSEWWRTGKVEIPWQAGVYVFVEDRGRVQVRHGVDDQRRDPICLDRYQATELAYLLLWALEDKSWTIPTHRDLARLQAAFGQVREIGEREFRDEVGRVERAMDEELRSMRSSEDSRERAPDAPGRKGDDATSEGSPPSP